MFWNEIELSKPFKNKSYQNSCYPLLLIKVKQKSLDALFKNALNAQHVEIKKFDNQFTHLTAPKTVCVQNAVL